MKHVELSTPPSGNARNVYEVRLMAPKNKGGGNKSCPFCGNRLAAFVHPANTKTYENWKRGEAWRIKAAFRTLPQGVTIRATLRVYGGKGFIESRDLDNVMKCVGDAVRDSSVIADDNVQSLVSWVVDYFSREEHLAILGDRGPSSEDDLKARVFVKLEPLAPGERLDEASLQRFLATREEREARRARRELLRGQREEARRSQSGLGI